MNKNNNHNYDDKTHDVIISQSHIDINPIVINMVQTIKTIISQITIFIRTYRYYRLFPVMAGLWHCFNHKKMIVKPKKHYSHMAGLLLF